MAKKKLTSMGIFEKTEPSPTQPADPEKSISWGLSLKASEWAEIEKIAAELNTKRGALAALFVRYAVKEYKAGKMKTKTTKTLDI
mgnify:CR=1 FL=1